MTGVTRPFSVPSVLFPSCDQGRRLRVFLMVPPSISDITDHHPISTSAATVICLLDHQRPAGGNRPQRSADEFSPALGGIPDWPRKHANLDMRAPKTLRGVPLEVCVREP